MARRTVEDCIQRVPNHFELVLLAAGRAKSLEAGADPMVPREGDKNPVVALREIGQDAVDLKLLHDGVVSSLQRYAVASEGDSDAEELKEVESELSGATTQDALYADNEFVESESFQVVDSTEA
ncbi:MAG: DNA-directed RNA polymerase subunit omega [Alphaproteobacteria bacterium]|nr:DNA-directed RNA polymerase subunit omega [Alphaproteobacteria bacterium]